MEDHFNHLIGILFQLKPIISLVSYLLRFLLATVVFQTYYWRPWQFWEVLAFCRMFLNWNLLFFMIRLGYGTWEESHRGKMSFYYMISRIYYQHNLHCWCWPWFFGWSSVWHYFTKKSYFFNPLFPQCSLWKESHYL